MIRGYRAEDRAMCLTLFDGNVPEYFHVSERADFEAFLDDLPERYLVVEDRGTIVGCGGFAIIPEKRLAEFCWGMVARDRHRAGFGRMLAEERIARIAATGAADTISLETTQHSAGFFERLGFRTQSIRPAGFAPGMDLYLMTRAVVVVDK
ncbi:GNAT family N-acetyltransferase [Sphingomonas cavernae]|uniref:GNAT family N-acetyltransferase n=1 Tax=Sphingomonas cavernae TaxID=2320861 RepID=A0A418WRV2_9SPHN|nr:GNAT family N-acetyltransferase [Sphingomonas cavernae]RJF93926.1 GNAT family N-acetyltransferase [Sphingomonas cavernae]